VKREQEDPDLAKVFVRPEGLAHYALARRVSLPASATAQEADADIRIPPSLAFGKMPTTTRNWQRWCAAGRKDKNMEEMSPYHETKLDVGVAQANMPAKVVDLGNTNAEVQERCVLCPPSFSLSDYYFCALASLRC
jgi:hypothetical protein